jgi:hypothetical protein
MGSSIVMTESLLEYRKNKYSQAGQDGIIEKIFNTIGIKNGNFVEFGAWDGIHSSNCRKLYEEGWSGVFIEGDKQKYDSLWKNYASESRIKCINSMVTIKGKNKFDNIMMEYGLNQSIDFLSIDVDGLDLEIFESIEKYLPSVACIEGGKGAHPFDSRMPINCISDIGQSLSVINQVAGKKGYKILVSFQDTFIIRKDLFSFFTVPEDLFKLYIDGYMAQEYMHIPMYAERLKVFNRRNKILEFMLKETSFNKYKEESDWEKEEEKHIFNTLLSLPDCLRNQQGGLSEMVLAYITGFLKANLPPKIKNYLKRILSK